MNKGLYDESGIFEKDEKIETCEKHGDFTAKRFYAGSRPLSVWSGCPECQSEREEHNKRVQAEAEAEEIERRRIERLRRCGIFERHQHCSFENFEATSDQMRQALSECKNIAQKVIDGERAPSLIMTGTVGTGKTHLACATAHECLKSKEIRNPKITTVFAMTREIKETWDKDSEYSEASLISWFSNFDLLIVDEMGIQNKSDTERNFLTEIIDNRYRSLKPTILIGNLTIEQMKELLGDRVVSRIKEDGGKVLVMNWEDHRGK